MKWMLWTWPTGIFFIIMALMLIAMTVWEVVQPSVERRGRIIPMKTTRGERLFIALLLSAFVTAFWVAVIPVSTWWMLAITVALVVIFLRWG